MVQGSEGREEEPFIMVQGREKKKNEGRRKEEEEEAGGGRPAGHRPG